jgi:hypothetical protein
MNNRFPWWWREGNAHLHMSKSEYSEEFTYEEEAVYSYGPPQTDVREDDDYLALFRQYKQLHERLFQPTDPFAVGMKELVLGTGELPQDSDVACALAIIENTEIRSYPLDPARCKAALLIACRAGHVEASQKLLEGREFSVEMEHLEAAIESRDWELVEILLDTGELNVYMNLQAVLDERVPDHVLVNMGRDASGACTIL